MTLSTRTVKTFPSTTFAEPEWKTLVERWYQLDTPSVMLCESYWQQRQDLKMPDMVLLNSPNLSFVTDQLFCKTLSPSKFVHTLPSVRTSALFQLMNWRGPAVSFIDTLENTLSYAKELVEKNLYAHIWVLNVEEVPTLKVDWVVVQKERGTP